MTRRTLAVRAALAATVASGCVWLAYHGAHGVMAMAWPSWGPGLRESFGVLAGVGLGVPAGIVVGGAIMEALS